MRTTRDYLPAAGRDWALPLYDPLVRLTGMDEVRAELVQGAALRGDERLLDIGCRRIVAVGRMDHPQLERDKVTAAGYDTDGINERALERGRSW